MQNGLAKHWMWMLCVVLLGFAPIAQAGIFGESEAEKETRIAKHVAEVLREPNRLIAQAQQAVEAGDTEEGIRLFRKAQTAIEKIEASEDTSGSAFASLRLKKFHCVSMLDALALKQSEVMDVRQAVTDTSELAKRLAQERAELAAETQQEEETAVLRPPTLADQLAIEEAKVLSAKGKLEVAKANLDEAKQALAEQEKLFAEVVQIHTAADARYFMAEQELRKAERAAQSQAELAKLTDNMERAKRELEIVRERLQEIKAQQQPLQTAVSQAEQVMKTETQAAEKVNRSVAVLKKAIADEKEAARKKAAEEAAKAEAERQRLATETLKRKQAEAAKLQAAKTKAEAALKKEIEMCEALWQMKRIEAFEEHVTEALAKWPDSPELLLQLARLRLLEGQGEDALELISMVPNKGELGKRAAFVAAGAYLTLGKAMDAMKILEPVEKTWPKDPDVCYNMAVVLVRLPEIDPNRDIAAKYYTRSVELGGRRSLSLERRLNME